MRAIPPVTRLGSSSVAAGDRSSRSGGRPRSGARGAVVGWNWTLACFTRASASPRAPTFSSRCVDEGMEGLESLKSSAASRGALLPWCGSAAGAGGGQPDSVLCVACFRNSTLASWPEPGKRDSSTCSLWAVWTRPAKSTMVVTSLLARGPRGWASSSVRTEQPLRDVLEVASGLSGCPDISMSLSVCACRACRSALMSSRRSCSIWPQAALQDSSFWIRLAIVLTASQSRSSTLAVITVRRLRRGFSSRQESKASKLECTSRRACLCGAQLDADCSSVRSSFRP
mmetsp:Transcript_3685/g.10737  ORF Transcript_3685/g.10737 Transcript_3685/m.10737 type:complete len:285 (-) Transcript_3685:478-1332(-)